MFELDVDKIDVVCQDFSDDRTFGFVVSNAQNIFFAFKAEKPAAQVRRRSEPVTLSSC